MQNQFKEVVVLFLYYYPYNGLQKYIKIVQTCRTGTIEFMLMFKIFAF